MFLNWYPAKSHAFRQFVGVGATPCSCKITHRDNFERKEMKKVKENKKEKLIPVVVRISQKNKSKIKELAEKQDKTEADLIREGIERIININMYKNDLDYISNRIKESISIDLKKFYKSQRKMQAKLLRTEVINTYFNNEMLEKLLGE